jgi:hypothetical protein
VFPVVDDPERANPTLRRVRLADEAIVREARQLAGQQLAELDDQMAAPSRAVVAQGSAFAHEEIQVASVAQPESG